MKNFNKISQIILLLFNLNGEAQWVVLPDRPYPNCDINSNPYVSIVKPVADDKIIYSTGCQYIHGAIIYIYASDDNLTINDLRFSNPFYNYGDSKLVNLYVYNDSTFSYCIYENGAAQEYYTQNTLKTKINTNEACGIATAISPNYVYGIPQGGVIFRANKMGQQVTHTFSPSYTAELDKLNFINDSVGFTQAHFFSNTSKSALIKITQYGITWSPVLIDSVDNISDYHISDQGNIYVLKKSGAVLKSIDAGTTFSPLTSAPAGTYSCIHFANNMTGFIGGTGGVLLKTQDGGNTWTSETSNSTQQINSIYTFNNNASYFVDAANKVYKSQQILGLSNVYDNSNELSVFPNPASNELTITCNSKNDNHVTSEITDISGRIVMRSEFQNLIKLDVSGLSNGIYIVRLVDNSRGVTIQKLLISK